MKIVAYPLNQQTGAVSGDAVTLGDDAEGDYIVGGQPQVSPAKAQFDDLAFAPEGARAAMGNARTTVAWSVSREHEDLGAAFRFEWDHGVEVPGYCHLEISEGESKRYLAFAVLTAVNETEPRSRSTKFSYEAHGGLATNDVPAGLTDEV